MTESLGFFSKQILVKVPAVTLIFWAIKILSTTVGETLADWINETLGFGLASTTEIMTVVLILVLSLQFVLRRYVPTVYWLTIVAISTIGTLLTDSLHDLAGWQNWQSLIVFAIGLAVTFLLWYRREHTLEIKSINNRRRELYYWVAILLTFALGTAGGDILGDDLGVPLGTAAIIFLASIALVALAWRAKWISQVLAFWITYVLTRPLGASLGDFLSQPTKDTGLGLGPTNTTLIFLGLIAALVVYLSVSKKDEIKA